MSTDANARGARPSLGHIPGLDGIRALAVLAIIAFHTQSEFGPGRLLRRRRLLRPLWLPDHVAVGQGVGRHRDDPPPPVLGRAGPTPAPGPLLAGGRDRDRHGLRAAAAHHAAHPGRRAVDRVLRVELVLHPWRGHLLLAHLATLAAAAHVVAGDRGAVLPGVAARRVGRAQVRDGADAERASQRRAGGPRSPRGPRGAVGHGAGRRAACGCCRRRCPPPTRSGRGAGDCRRFSRWRAWARWPRPSGWWSWRRTATRRAPTTAPTAGPRPCWSAPPSPSG